MMCPPKSRMDILTDEEIKNVIDRSKLAAKYNEAIDNQSAYEILNDKLEEAEKRTETIKQQQTTKKQTKKEETIFDNPMMKQMGRTAASTITRTLLGVLGLGGKRRKSLF